MKSGLWRTSKKKLSEIGHKSREQIEFDYDTWKLRTKKIKSIFSIEKAYIPQLFLLDKLFCGQCKTFYNAKHFFLVALFYRKIGRKVTFDFRDP